MNKKTNYLKTKQTKDFYNVYYEELMEIVKNEYLELCGRVLEQMDSFIQDIKSENREQFQNKYGDLELAMLAEYCLNATYSLTVR